MRRLKHFITAIILCLVLPCSYGNAISVEVNGKPLESPVYLQDGITYVPLVDLLHTLNGGTASWDGKKVTVLSELYTLTIPIAAESVSVDDSQFPLNGKTFIENGRTYVPLRSLANLLGADVTYTDANTPVSVTSREKFSYTEEDFDWMSRIISAESCGECLMGQIAVGNVVLHRLHCDRYPNTIREVILDDEYAVQFEPVENGSINNSPTRQSILAAKLVFAGVEAVENCLYFFSPALSEGTWIQENTTYVTTIGCHQFYCDPVN